MKSNKFKLLESGFVSLIELLLVLVVICILYYIAINMYSKKQSSGQDINTSTPKAALDTARETVNEINKQQLNRMKEIQ